MSAQITRSPVKSIEITARGDIGEFVESLLAFATVGVLSEAVGDQVNYVNAEFIAEERDIELLTDIKPNTSGFHNKIELRLLTQKSAIRISGTVFDETVQRVVEIDDYDLDVEPRGNMIFFRNTDTPGVIGDVGRIIAQNEVNISDFRLGRDKTGLALAVVRIDGQVSREMLEELSALEACIDVSYASL